MSDLNEIYGAALALPSELSGILISDAPAPHEGASGLYALGPELNGFPTYYFGDYVIANWYGDNYALYHKDWAVPDADNEIWYLGPQGTGPVLGGLLDEPYPTLQGVGAEGGGLPAALLQEGSPENDLPKYPSASTLPVSPVNPVTVPQASNLPTSSANRISSPAANALPLSSLNSVGTFSPAITPPGFPSYLIQPDSPSISVRSGSSNLYFKVITTSGSRYRLVNRTTGVESAYANSDATITISLRANEWNLIGVEVEGGLGTDIKNFDVNRNLGYIGGSFVFHFTGHCPRYFTLGGGGYGAKLLNIELPLSMPLNYFQGISVGLSAEVIDRLLIACDAGAGTVTNASLVFNNNPGSSDQLRSDAGLTALNSLLFKGWTITR